MAHEVSRRIVLGGIASLAVDAYMGGDSPSTAPVQEQYPYAFNPDRQVLPGRPVGIWVDRRENERSGQTFTTRSEDVPKLTTVLSPRAQQRGYISYITTSGEEYQEAAFVSERQLQPLYDAMAPLEELRSSGPRCAIVTFPLSQSAIDYGLTTNGHPDPEHNTISLDMKTDHPVEIESLQQLMFHERLHVIHDTFTFPQSYYDLHTALTDDAKGLLNSYEQHFRAQGLSEEDAFRKKVEAGITYDDPPSLKALGPLANLVSESSYDLTAERQVGHPLMDVHELFASTLTIARFYPRSLLTSVAALDRPADRQLIKDVVGGSIQLLRQYADTPQKADALFATPVLDFVTG